MRPVIILFARAPVAGRVKTRLQPPLSAEQATELHTCFVRDMLEMLEPFAAGADLQLHTDLETHEWDDAGVGRYRQVQGDLGRKMYHALQAGLAAGSPRVMIVGSDSPTLPPSHLRKLLDARADVALGPADDGGYYAICCRKTHPEMFAGVQWSGSRALEQTAKAAGACGLTVELGDSWFDVDHPADLERLARSPVLPPRTAAWLRRYGEDLLGRRPTR